MSNLIKKRVKEAKVEIVLEVVSEYFDRVGFSKPTMSDIAKEVGISVGALYKLFASKDELFFAYIGYQIEKFHKELVVATAKKEPQEKLEIFVEMKFSTFVSKRKAIEDPILGDPLFFVKMNAQKVNPSKPIFEFLANEFEKLSLKQSSKESDFNKVAYLFNSYTMGYIEHWLNFGGELKSDSKQVVEMFLNGLLSNS